MCKDLETRHGTISHCLFGMDSTFPTFPTPRNPSYPLSLCLTQPQRSLSDPSRPVHKHNREYGACSWWGRPCPCLCPSLVSARWPGTTTQLKQTLLTPNSRYLVSWNGSCGKRRSLARLPCPGPGHTTCVWWLRNSNLAASGSHTHTPTPTCGP